MTEEKTAQQPEIIQIPEEKRKEYLEDIGSLTFSYDAGLLLQAELVLNYGKVEKMVLGENTEKRISPYFSNSALKRALVTSTQSNLIASAIWDRLGLSYIRKGLNQEDRELQTAIIELTARKRLSGQVPPTKEDLDIFLQSIQRQGMVIDDIDLEKARDRILKAWEKGYVSERQIIRHLFIAGAKDVVFPDRKFTLKGLPNDADWLYTFHVIKLAVMHRLVTEGLKKLDATRFDVDDVYKPPDSMKEIWPPFSQAYQRAGYITHESIWTHELLRPDGEYKAYIPEV